jgi:hypothetical protein
MHSFSTSTVLAAFLTALGCAGKGGGSGDGSAAQAPHGGKAHAIPGTIEAEAFDEGPDGVAYHDVDPQNQGAPYRTTSVDVEERKDASGGYGVGWTRAGEWLEYTVAVTAPGRYRLEVPVASAGKGGTFHLEFNGADRTGPIAIPDTGSWQKLVVIARDDIRLDAGPQVMRVVMATEGETKSVADMDFFRFTLAP